MIRRLHLRMLLLGLALIALFVGQANVARAFSGHDLIRSVWNSSFCVDIPQYGRASINGDPVQVYQCHGGSNQLFDVNSSSGLIRPLSASSMCLDIPHYGRPPQSGDLLQLYQCHGGINQQFYVASDGSIHSWWNTNLCIDIPYYGRPPQNGDRLQLYQCQGTSNQRWTFPAG